MGNPTERTMYLVWNGDLANFDGAAADSPWWSEEEPAVNHLLAVAVQTWIGSTWKTREITVDSSRSHVPYADADRTMIMPPEGGVAVTVIKAAKLQ